MSGDSTSYSAINQSVLSMLGDCILGWSHVETATDNSLRAMLHISGMALGATEMVVLNLAIREKCSVMLSLAFVYRLDDDWFGELSGHLNAISNDLRNQRNRILHDTWSIV